MRYAYRPCADVDTVKGVRKTDNAPDLTLLNTDNPVSSIPAVKEWQGPAL